jgi:hypothetical protein
MLSSVVFKVETTSVRVAAPEISTFTPVFWEIELLYGVGVVPVASNHIKYSRTSDAAFLRK